MNSPYEWINEDNLNNEELPGIKDFYSSLKLETGLENMAFFQILIMNKTQ